MQWLPGARMGPPGARAQGAVARDILWPVRARARVSRSKFRKIRAPQCQTAVKMGGRTVGIPTEGKLPSSLISVEYMHLYSMHDFNRLMSAMSIDGIWQNNLIYFEIRQNAASLFGIRIRIQGG